MYSDKTYILSRSEDPTTDTELNAIAAAAIHGCKISTYRYSYYLFDFDNLIFLN